MAKKPLVTTCNFEDTDTESNSSLQWLTSKEPIATHNFFKMTENKSWDNSLSQKKDFKEIKVDSSKLKGRLEKSLEVTWTILKDKARFKDQSNRSSNSWTRETSQQWTNILKSNVEQLLLACKQGDLKQVK